MWLVSNNRRAAMGIGTLIIFIAMIMIAAIAAAIMIYAANYLRTQGKDMVRTKSAELGFTPSGLRILGIVADMKEDGLEHKPLSLYLIYELKIRISLADPNDIIHLHDVRIYIYTPRIEVHLYPNESYVYQNGTHSNRTVFAISPIYDDDRSITTNHILNNDDWLLFWIDCNRTGLKLVPNTDVTIELEVKNRGISKITFRTPPTYGARYIVIL